MYMSTADYLHGNVTGPMHKWDCVCKLTEGQLKGSVCLNDGHTHSIFNLGCRGQTE